MTHTALTPQLDLQTVIDHWADLDDALGTPNTTTWPPAGLAAHLNNLAQLADHEVELLRELRAAEKADRNSEATMGERPIPIRAAVHDAQTAVQEHLVGLADALAERIQRPIVARIRAAGPGDDVGLQLATASMRDAVDPRRWSYTDPLRRTAPFAAIWLQQRLDGADGPFAPLTAQQRETIAGAAANAADRVLQALEMYRRRRPVNVDCPHCRGPLVVEGGDGQPPSVRCEECGWARHAADDVA